MRALAVIRASTSQSRKSKWSKKLRETREQVEDITQNKHTLRGPSSLQELDALSAKGDKFLHQILPNESMRGQIQAMKESTTRSNTHIIRRSLL
jgi:hypothetical protein